MTVMALLTHIRVVVNHTAHPIAKFSIVKYLALIVTTRRVNIVRTVPSQYARLSVHPSHAASVSKRLCICSKFIHHQNSVATPPRGRQMQGVWKNHDFGTNSRIWSIERRHFNNLERPPPHDSR